MKKFLLLLTMVLTLCVPARAAKGEKFNDGIFTYTVLSENTAMLTGVNMQLDGDITIPMYATDGSSNYLVTEIHDGAFSFCESLTSVTIPNSVTYIGDNAFEYCRSLTSVTIPNSVSYIGLFAFYFCDSLTSVTIPNSVTSIQTQTFMLCHSLTSVTIPNSMTSIGDSAFRECSSLTSVTIPSSVTSISNYAFGLCDSLTSVTIPNSVTYIGDNAFVYCRSLISVTIPNSVTSIGVGAFGHCSSLTSVTIPNSVTSIGMYSFEGCSALTIIIAQPTTPPCTSYRTFDGVPNDAVVYIPYGTYKAYSVAEGWSYFFDFREAEVAGIDGVKADIENSPAEYFNLSGVRVNSGTLTPGTYIKRQGNKSEKVLVQ